MFLVPFLLPLFSLKAMVDISVVFFKSSSICSDHETLSKIPERCMLTVVNSAVLSGRVINKQGVLKT